MIIKNREELETTALRGYALDIISAGIDRVLPFNIMKSALSYDASGNTLTIQGDSYSLSIGRLFVIGGGKASGLMAETLEKIIPPDHITAGVVNCKGGQYQADKIKIIIAGHPIPDQRGVAGVTEMLSLKECYHIDKNDIVICLISGGGSALMPNPVPGLSLEDQQKVTSLLLASGAEIGEINTVRKHLSRIKGGRLGQFFAPATVISLILSDVIGNDLSTIASGPTFPESSTFYDACNILKKYGLFDKAPPTAIAYLEKGCRGEIAEGPNKLDNCHNYIIGDNHLALESMSAKAKELGFSPHIVTAEQKGEPSAVAQLIAKEISEGKYDGKDALLLGGETTPVLPPRPGKGGRNQHYTAESMLAMQNYPGEWVVASSGTDGSDYIPEVAGAIVDRLSLDTIKTAGLDVQSYLDRYDTNTLFNRMGRSLIITGDTGTNVGDVIVYLLPKKRQT